MTGPFFLRRNVATGGALGLRADAPASPGTAEPQGSAAFLTDDQEFLASPNPAGPDAPGSAHDGGEADPITLVREDLGAGQGRIRDDLLVGSAPGSGTYYAGPQDGLSDAPVRVCRKCSAQSQVSGDACPYCDARFSGRRLRGGARKAGAPTIATSTRTFSPTQQQSGTMTRGQKIVLPVVGMFALIGVGLGLFALSSEPSTAPLQRQVSVLKATATAQRQEIAALKTETASLKVATAGAATAGNMTALQTNVGALSKTVTGVQSDLSQVHTCLPELDQEVNTLGVNTSTGSILLNDGTTDTFLTDAYINNPTVISNNCTKFLTGQ
jgi:hypothetical protein